MKGFLAIDIEFTGSTPNDIVFAFGMSHSIYNTNSTCTSQSICLNLHKPIHTSWGVYWKQMSWDLDCWENFWKHNVSMLDYLQDRSKVHLVDFEDHFVYIINNMLAQAEGLYSKTVILSDTLLVDTVLVSHLLLKYGYISLSHTRNKEYRIGVQVNSFAEGKFQETPYCSKRKEINNFKNTINKPYTHDPSEDSAFILEFYFRLCTARN